MAVSSKAIFDLTDDALKSIIRGNAHVTAISQNDMLQELDRRAARRQATASMILSVVGLGIAVAALIVTALKA